MQEEKKININKQEIMNYMRDKNWNALTNYYDNTFKIVVDCSSGEPIRFAYSADVVDIFQVILENVVGKLDEIVHDDLFLKFYISLFRALRNYTLNKTAQNVLVDNQTIVPNVIKLLTKFLIDLKSDVKYTKIIKVMLQFLSNLTTFANNKANVLLSLRFLIIDLLSNSDYEPIIYALFYNVIKDTKINLKMINENINHVLLNLMSTSENNEYLEYIIVELVQNSSFYNDYPHYIHKQKLLILDTVKEHMYNKDFKVEEDFIEILAQQFKTKCNKILALASQNDEELEAIEVNYLLDILASLSGIEQYLLDMQNDKALLDECAKLLEIIQCLGKVENNCFTSIQKLADVTSPADSMKMHPAFGFKAGLIRILGNLCWKNKGNQDQLRSCGTITVLLDCCNIDARNPFIMQWTILAVRNLCENNAENQKIIASLTQQGVVSSAVLHEMGLTVHSDGSDQITLIPLETLKNVQNKQFNT